MPGPYYVEVKTKEGKIIPFFKDNGLSEIKADNLAEHLLFPKIADVFGYVEARKVLMDQNNPFQEPEIDEEALAHLKVKLEKSATYGKQEFFEDTSDYDKDPDRFLKYAKQYVVGAHAVETAETGEAELTVEELYIVWFSKTLQNWKVMISTTRPGDGLYFEVTHNGDKLETYVDTYQKTSNQVFSHHDF